MGSPLMLFMHHLKRACKVLISDITETNRIHMVLFGMKNRTLGPYLAAINGFLISVM
jgi:hypothetical protein